MIRSIGVADSSPEIIELCVRWYLTYRLSYRDLVETMAERGVSVSRSTIREFANQHDQELSRVLQALCITRAV